MSTPRASFASKRLAALAVMASVAVPAFAGNGYMTHGFGQKSKGMGGVAAALAEDSLGAANNPASLAWVGTRLDIGAEWLSGARHAERSGAGIATLNGRIDSGRKHFLVPEIGYSQVISPDLSVGVSAYGNGGMNTSYHQGNFNCGAGPANIVCGNGKLGLDIIQLIVAPTVAYKLTPEHAVGAALLLGYQRFKAEGLEAFDNAPGFPPFTSSPGNVTNRGNDSTTGAGLRVGWQGRLSDVITLGASYSSKVYMGKLKKYKGLLAEGGSFDIPANYSVGVAFKPTPHWTLAADYMRIEYSKVASVGNPSTATAPLGADNGPGFGWRDVKVVKLGTSWSMDETLTLRAGFNRGSKAIDPKDVTFNILAPALAQNHYTAGLTYATGKDSEWTGALMIAPRQSITGPSLFNAVLGPGAGGNETLSLRMFSVGVAWARKY